MRIPWQRFELGTTTMGEVASHCPHTEWVKGKTLSSTEDAEVAKNATAFLNFEVITHHAPPIDGKDNISCQNK